MQLFNSLDKTWDFPGTAHLISYLERDVWQKAAYTSLQGNAEADR